MNRFEFIDIAKAFAIILVVIGHDYPASSPMWYSELHSFIYLFHMPLFMGLSGYLFGKTYHKTDYLSFVWKKFSRLMIPYFCLSLLITSIKLISQLIIKIENPVTVSTFLKIFYYPEAGFYLWFMYTLFLIFTIVPLFNNKLNFLLVLSAILFFIPCDFDNVFYLNQVKKMLLYFAIGWSLSNLNVKRIYLKTQYLYVLSAFLLLALLVTYHFKDIYSVARDNKFISLTGSVTGGLFIVSLSYIVSLSKVKFKHYLIGIGIYSSAIYLFHTICMGPVKYLINKFPVTDIPCNFMLTTFIICLAGIILPMIFAKYIINKNKLFSFLLLGESAK